MSKNNNRSKIENLPGGVGLVGLDDLVQLLDRPGRLAWLRFLGGVMSGAGYLAGAALMLVLLSLAVKHLGGVPWIGDLIRQIGNAAKAK